MSKKLVVLGFQILLAAMVAAQPRACRDIADEPNHQLLFQNDAVRIFQLDLQGAKGTDEFCAPHPYLRIIATDGETSDVVTGEVTYKHIWKAGEAHFVYQPKQKAIRNESGLAFREYDIETLHPVPFNPLYDTNADIDLLYGEPAINANHMITAVRGSLTLSKVALGPGDQFLIGESSHFVVALSTVELAYGKDKQLKLETGEAARLPGDSEIQLKNTGTREARFITVEF